MQLDFSSFRKALDSLDKAIQRAQAAASDEELRDAVIQRFEYTYELAWKMLKRQLEQDLPSPSEVDHLSFRDLLREALERGLISNFDVWIVYRNLRSITFHVYDRQKAEQVYKEVLTFTKDARSLLMELEKRQ